MPRSRGAEEPRSRGAASRPHRHVRAFARAALAKLLRCSASFTSRCSAAFRSSRRCRVTAARANLRPRESTRHPFRSWRRESVRHRGMQLCIGMQLCTGLRCSAAFRLHSDSAGHRWKCVARRERRAVADRRGWWRDEVHDRGSCPWRMQPCIVSCQEALLGLHLGTRAVICICHLGRVPDRVGWPMLRGRVPVLDFHRTRGVPRAHRSVRRHCNGHGGNLRG